MAKVLIVDDEAIITNQMSEIAQREGYNVFTASDGAEALEILKKNSMDFILTDLQMDKLGGADMVEIINGREGSKREENAREYFNGNVNAYDAFVQTHKSTPILLMSKDESSASKLAEMVGALEGSFPKFYDKESPFRENQLVDVLRKYLAN